MSDMFNRIEREVAINASAQRVWELVAEPGWYINDKNFANHEITYDGDVATVCDDQYGEFKLTIVQLDEPRYAAFRWHIEPDVSSSSTLVEFWVTPHASGVMLKVVGSGFESLSEPEVNRRSRFDEHSAGWVHELDLARQYFERSTASA